MQPINMMLYYWDKKLKKRLHTLEADIITNKKDVDLVFQMNAIALVSVKKSLPY